MAGDLERVRELIADGVDVSTPLADGTTPILLAARHRQVPILRALAAVGARLEDLEVLNFPERLMLFTDASIDDLTVAREAGRSVRELIGHDCHGVDATAGLTAYAPIASAAWRTRCEDDVVARLQIRDAGPDTLHDARCLVTEHDGKRRREAPVHDAEI